MTNVRINEFQENIRNAVFDIKQTINRVLKVILSSIFTWYINKNWKYNNFFYMTNLMLLAYMHIHISLFIVHFIHRQTDSTHSKFRCCRFLRTVYVNMLKNTCKVESSSHMVSHWKVANIHKNQKVPTLKMLHMYLLYWALGRDSLPWKVWGWCLKILAEKRYVIFAD
jgi:hypothetical protein